MKESHRNSVSAIWNRGVPCERRRVARSQQTGNRFVESEPHDLRERANLRRTTDRSR